eukprot:TRINITY_DN1890_c0_g1_i1.p1 TRINITY_DN1890_c0_g1~~TRINITY_DN1890_c0_g1_i1.p1  ORF type:complete len:120 (-),score=21.86 TRINITY_DN1890_c0_g1_i1:201-560(-)
MSLAASTEGFLTSVGVRRDRVGVVAQCLDRLFLSTAAFGLTGFVLGWRRVRPARLRIVGKSLAGIAVGTFTAGVSLVFAPNMFCESDALEAMSNINLEAAASAAASSPSNTPSNTPKSR